MKTQIVKIDAGDIEISKLPIGKYAELLKAIKQLPKSVQGMEKMDNQAIFDNLPNIIGESLPDFINLLTIATPLTKEQVEAMGLDEITRVVLGVIEVNNFAEVYNNIKKAVARPAPTTK